MNPNQFRHFGLIVQDNPYAERPKIIRTPEDHYNFI